MDFNRASTVTALVAALLITSGSLALLYAAAIAAPTGTSFSAALAFTILEPTTPPALLEQACARARALRAQTTSRAHEPALTIAHAPRARIFRCGCVLGRFCADDVRRCGRPQRSVACTALAAV